MGFEPTVTLFNNDCLDAMQSIHSKSVNMILCDLLYGTTYNKWDGVIPFSSLWKGYERIITDNGAIVLFGDGMFTDNFDVVQS